MVATFPLMEHRAATEEVIRLIPDMAKSSPEQVLIKRAMDLKWAPAQLMKVAQVYNTCSTLHAQTIDRNSMPQLVDTSAVVNDYVNQSGRSSLKVASSFLSGEPAEESALQKVASILDETPGDVPYVWSEAPVKSAAQERAVDPKLARRWAVEDFTKSAHQVMRRVDAIVDQRRAYRATMDKAASELRTSLRAGDDAVFIDLERDGRACREPGMVKQALDQLEAIAKEAGASVMRFDPTRHTDSILGRDTTGKLNLLDAVNESFIKYACEFSALEEDLETLLKCAAAAPDDADNRLGNLMDKVKDSLLHIEDLTKSAAFPEKKPEPEADLTPTKVVYLQNTEAPEKGKGDKTPEPKLTDLGVAPDAMQTIADKVVSVVSPPARVMQWASDDLGGIIEGEGKKYQARQAALQRELDGDAVDIKSLHNLRRLMILDEVVAEADPEVAVEAYNSIRRAHPEVANDIGMLRLLMRQAVQHQGLDIDTASVVRKFGDGTKLTGPAPATSPASK